MHTRTVMLTHTITHTHTAAHLQKERNFLGALSPDLSYFFDKVYFQIIEYEPFQMKLGVKLNLLHPNAIIRSSCHCCGNQKVIRSSNKKLSLSHFHISGTARNFVNRSTVANAKYCLCKGSNNMSRVVSEDFNQNTTY